MTAHHTCTDTCKQDDYFHMSMRGENMITFEKELRNCLTRCAFNGMHYQRINNEFISHETEALINLVADTVLKAIGELDGLTEYEKDTLSTEALKRAKKFFRIRNNLRAEQLARAEELGIKEK